MLKYKNVVFDFGNVIATFDEDSILDQFCNTPEDHAILKHAVFQYWGELDEGTCDYHTALEHALSLVPERLCPNVRNFFQNWYKHLTPIKEIWALIRHLKEMGASLYILSNAPTQFAEHATFYEIVQEFDGVVFSGPITMAKPKPEIYQYLFDTYHLKPEECFFVDDKPENIIAGKSLGMDGYIFDRDTSVLMQMLGLKNEI